jgi:hypothetical protein
MESNWLADLLLLHPIELAARARDSSAESRELATFTYYSPPKWNVTAELKDA